MPQQPALSPSQASPSRTSAPAVCSRSSCATDASVAVASGACAYFGGASVGDLRPESGDPFDDRSDCGLPDRPLLIRFEFSLKGRTTETIDRRAFFSLSPPASTLRFRISFQFACAARPHSDRR